MNRWVRIGVAILIGVLLLRFSFVVLGLAMRLVSLLFPLLMLIGAGFVVYGIYRYLQKRATQARLHDSLDDD
ncbi:MAG: hypothetical protein SNJ72_08635 [Fimbriimonadales bacterium]